MESGAWCGGEPNDYNGQDENFAAASRTRSPQWCLVDIRGTQSSTRFVCEKSEYDKCAVEDCYVWMFRPASFLSLSAGRTGLHLSSGGRS